MIDLVDNTYVSNCVYYDIKHFVNCFKDCTDMWPIISVSLSDSRLSKKPQVLVISVTRFSEEFHSDIEGCVAYHTFRPGMGGGLKFFFVDNSLKSEHLPELSKWNPCADICCVNKSPTPDVSITVLGV